MDTVASAELEKQITVSSSGDNTLLAALGASKKTRMLRGIATAASNVDLILKTGSTAMTGAITLVAKTPYELPELTGGANEALIANLGSAVSVVFSFKYVQVKSV